MNEAVRAVDAQHDAIGRDTPQAWRQPHVDHVAGAAVDALGACHAHAQVPIGQPQRAEQEQPVAFGHERGGVLRGGVGASRGVEPDCRLADIGAPASATPHDLLAAHRSGVSLRNNARPRHQPLLRTAAKACVDDLGLDAVHQRAPLAAVADVDVGQLKVGVEPMRLRALAEPGGRVSVASGWRGERQRGAAAADEPRQRERAQHRAA
jgi:hypothetical protein